MKQSKPNKSKWTIIIIILAVIAIYLVVEMFRSGYVESGAANTKTEKSAADSLK